MLHFLSATSDIQLYASVKDKKLWMQKYRYYTPAYYELLELQLFFMNIAAALKTCQCNTQK